MSNVRTTQCEEEREPQGSVSFDERATLCEIERILRDYLETYYKPHMARHDRAFSPGTISMVESIKPLLEHLEEGRRAAT